MFGVGSDMQKAQGIDLAPADIIKLEMDIFRYDVSGTLWADLIANSAENIAWVKEQGCLMRDVVDNHPPNGLVDTAHWWDSNGATGYVAPMVARLEELGGQLLLETPAHELIVDGDAVVGVYVESPEGIVRIDAGAVVIATGGFADNPEMIRPASWAHALGPCPHKRTRSNRGLPSKARSQDRKARHMPPNR